MQNSSSKKRPQDVNQLTKFIVDLATGNPITEDISPIADKGKNPAAFELGRLGRQKDKDKAAKSHLNNARK